MEHLKKALLNQTDIGTRSSLSKERLRKNKKRVVSTLFLFLLLFITACDFESPEKWETPGWYIDLTLPLINKKYSFAEILNDSSFFNDTLNVALHYDDTVSNVIHVTYPVKIDSSGLPDEIFNINIGSSSLDIPDIGFGAGDILIEMPIEMEDKIDSTLYSLSDLSAIDLSAIIEQFGCLPLSDPVTDVSILESIAEVLPDTQITVPMPIDMDFPMFIFNSIVFSEGEWNFGIDNNLFFNLDTANVTVKSGENILYEANIGPVNAGGSKSNTAILSVSDSLSWDTVSISSDFIAEINIGVDPDQDGIIECLWNENAPPFYTCDDITNPVSDLGSLEGINPSLYQNDDCDDDCSGTCVPLFYCGGYGYIGVKETCEKYEYIGDFREFDLGDLDNSGWSSFAPNIPIYTYTDSDPNNPMIAYYPFDGTCEGATLNDSQTCELTDGYGIEQSCDSDCEQGYKIANSGWDVSVNDNLSLDVDFTNIFETVRKVDISTNPDWDTTIIISKDFPGFENMEIKRAIIAQDSDEYPNKFSLTVINELFADLNLQFDFINFFNAETGDFLSKDFIIEANGGVLDTAVNFSEYIIAHGIPSEEVVDAMDFNIQASISEGNYTIYAQDNEIYIKPPVFDLVKMSNISLQYIAAITHELKMDALPSPPIDFPNGFTDVEFMDFIMEVELFNEIGIPADTINLTIQGTNGSHLFE